MCPDSLFLNSRNISEYDIDSLVQDCSNSSVLAMELLQSCTKASYIVYVFAKSCQNPEFFPKRFFKSYLCFEI